MIDYDHYAQEWIAGRLEPSIGRDAWNLIAATEAALIRELIPDANQIVEVGCGVGRLTPHLARLFRDVIACDTSQGMLRATRLATAGLLNVRVIEAWSGLPYPRGDAAVIWDVIDADWTLDMADELVDACLHACPVALVGRVRSEWHPWPGRVVKQGRSWWLLSARPGITLP